jgi:hypothetical protein
MADHELVEDDERERFAGTSAVDDRPAEDCERGREDEAAVRNGRFQRDSAVDETRTTR